MINFLKKIFYSIPFGMKGAEDVMLSQKTSLLTDNTGVVEVIQDKRLSKDLLKGEVTQQVEELRYRDYKVSNESKKIKYLGDGVSQKIDKDNIDYKNHKFIVENSIICENINDELNRIDSYGEDRYVLSIIYNNIPKFKVESYCSRIEVFIVDGKCEFVLCFPKYANKYRVSTKAFINELEKINSNINDYVFQHNELCSNINTIKFTTYKAINEDDLIQYTLYGIECVGFNAEEHEYKIRYKTSNYIRENLVIKYFSNTMDEKYKNNQRKDAVYSIQDCDRTETCDECGKIINKYDADITLETLGKRLCVECLERKMLNS